MKRAFLAVLAMVLLVGLSGCAILGDLSPEEQQLKARMTFNNLVEGYIVKYRTADLATQDKWKTDVDPLIKKAIAALDLWGLALKLTDPSKAIEQQKVFLLIKDELLDLMIDSFVE